jgi:hypothetical protein
MDIFDLEPTSAAKGKARATDESSKRSIYHMLPNKAKLAWAGITRKHFHSLPSPMSFTSFLAANPLPPKPLHTKAKDLDTILPILFPDWFGPNANHECVYRDLLFEFIKFDLPERTTANLAGQF